MSETIDINPPLMSGDSVDVSVKEETPPGAICISYQQMQELLGHGKKDFPYECFYWDITRPIKNLELKIFIPSHLAPQKVASDVWLGPSRITCLQEFPRVEKSFTRKSVPGHIEFDLDVAFPIAGLIYAVRWVPKGSPD